MLMLYQFPISHYCEKVRWALDYKGIKYQQVSLLPGMHLRKTKKMAKRSNVPVLVNEETVIQGSSEIIDYLDNRFELMQLTPQYHDLQKQALEWEQYADKNIGPQVRLVIYHIMLDYPDLVIPMFTQAGPWYGKFLMKRMFPKLVEKMRAYMKIDEHSASKSNDLLLKSVDYLAEHYAKNKFMVGDQFSRADLTAAALLAPIVMPQKYDVIWPEEIPDRMQEFAAQFDGKLDWLNRFYNDYR